MKSRIMYIECRSSGQSGPARIGRVSFSKLGRSLYYHGKCFQSLESKSLKENYYDIATGERYWISGCKKRGGDRLYPGTVEIDDDVREEYWKEIRNLPNRVEQTVIIRRGKYRGKVSR